MASIYLRINYTTIPASIKPRLQVWCNKISTFSKANSHFNSLYRPMIIIIDYYKHNYIHTKRFFRNKILWILTGKKHMTEIKISMVSNCTSHKGSRTLCLLYNVLYFRQSWSTKQIIWMEKVVWNRFNRRLGADHSWVLINYFGPCSWILYIEHSNSKMHDSFCKLWTTIHSNHSRPSLVL